MTIETNKDLIALQEIGKIVAITLKDMMNKAEPGMSTAELDIIGKNLLEKYVRNLPQRLLMDFLATHV
jgi:methionyl aminopeptidase